MHSRRRDRGPYDAAVIHPILDEALFCTVSYADASREPVTIPTNYVCVEDCIYLHGKVSSELIRRMSNGAFVSINVTIFDDLVLARSAFNHSANYRSVMIDGVPEPVTLDAEKLSILEKFSDKYTPGRWPHIKQPTSAELKSTGIVKISLQNSIARVKTGPPEDDAPDYSNTAYWAGLIPLKLYSLPAIPDPKLLSGIPTPAHVMDFNIIPPLPTQQISWKTTLSLVVFASVIGFASFYACKRAK